MKFHILTIFEEFYDSFLNTSLIKKAIDKKIIGVELYDIRKFSEDKHKKVDDTPYGGGPGMVMKIEPIVRCLKSIKTSGDTNIILLAPTGTLFTQSKAIEFYNKFDELIIICGRYEGIDERIVKYCDSIISVGEYILSGGETASLILIESISRLIPGVVGDYESVENETFMHGNIDYPVYTRPPEFEGQHVPEVLLSGNHKKINEWRKNQSNLRRQNM